MTFAQRTPALRAAPWRQVLPALLLVLAAVLVAYRDTAAAMVSIWWRSETFAHAFLVPPIVLWLIWRQRHVLAALRPQPCAWMLLPMAAIAFTWLLGDLAAVNTVTQLAMTALLVFSVPALLGLPVARAILFPLGFLFFAVPIGEFLLPQLMSWTADFTVLALRASGVPVFREGNQFAIPTGNWSVVEACSGVRYLIASLVVGTLFAYLNYRSARRRWIFVGISIVVPIIANWARAYLIVMLGHLSNNKLAVGADHLIYGWVFFGLVMGLMFAIGVRWSEPPEAVKAPAAAVAAASPSAHPGRPQEFWQVATAAVVLVLVPHLVLWEIGGGDNALLSQVAPLTNLADGWQASDDSTSVWRPAFHNPSAELNSTYTSQGREVGVYIGYYRAQTFSRKLVSSDNELVTSNDRVWAQIAPAGSYTLQGLERAPTVRTVRLRRVSSLGVPEQRLLVWQLYWVGGRLTANDQWAKVYAALDRLLGRGDDSAVIVLYARDGPPGEAVATLESFARANLGAIVEQLDKTRHGLSASIATNSHRTLTER